MEEGRVGTDQGLMIVDDGGLMIEKKNRFVWRVWPMLNFQWGLKWLRN
jgi:hypothetical protein